MNLPKNKRSLLEDFHWPNVLNSKVYQKLQGRSKLYNIFVHQKVKHAFCVKKKRKVTAELNSFLHSKFVDAALQPSPLQPFSVLDFFDERLCLFLKYASRMRNTSPEMMLAAILPTTAACLGPDVKLKVNSYGSFSLPANLFLIGK